MAGRFRCFRCHYQFPRSLLRRGRNTCPSCHAPLGTLDEAPRTPARPPRNRRMFAAAPLCAVAVLLVAGAAIARTALNRPAPERPQPAALVTPVPQTGKPSGAVKHSPPPNHFTPPDPPHSQDPKPANLQQPTRTVQEPSEPATAPETEKLAEMRLPPFKRLDRATEDDLRKQLRQLPELALDKVTAAHLQSEEKREAQQQKHTPGAPPLLTTQREWQGVPFRKASDCDLNDEEGKTLSSLSASLKSLLEDTNNGRPIEPLRSALLQKKRAEWVRPEAVPCLVQVLQAENARVRLLLVEILSQIDHTKATRALARRAVADLNPEVRRWAAYYLTGRDRQDYEPELMAGLRYPWAAAQAHAAEALGFLKDRDAVPALARMLRQPDPALPFPVRQHGQETFVVREVVRVNHHRNCLLCHRPSLDESDPVRRYVPTPDKPLEGSKYASIREVTSIDTTKLFQSGFCSGPGYGFAGGYGLGNTLVVTYKSEEDTNRTYVRADTTYIRQDFSVTQPVANHGKWPEEQRYDYLVRVRPATPAEIQFAAQKSGARAATSERAAILFALREITGKDYRTDAEP
jgi:hypothetical protein